MRTSRLLNGSLRRLPATARILGTVMRGSLLGAASVAAQEVDEAGLVVDLALAVDGHLAEAALAVGLDDGVQRQLLRVERVLLELEVLLGVLLLPLRALES